MNDYTKFSNKKSEITLEKKIEETTAPVEEVVTPEEPLYGVVSDCARLNVREDPNAEAEVLCVIEEGSEVVIVGSESTEEFYKVFTAAGVEGFCMKMFVTLVP